ncbi:MAG: acyloxyacyl hydrolase [Acidobacteriaceae bacterium]|jgi:hypothetical protein
MDDTVSSIRRKIPSRFLSCIVLLALGLLAPQIGAAQESGSVPDNSGLRNQVESELAFEGQGSFGNYKIFAQGEHSKLFSSGVEYDRHSWGYFLGSQVDYVAEFLPFVLLDEPLYLNYYGVPNGTGKKKQDMQQVPGIGISPIGIRFLWRDGRAIEPYLAIKGGILVFSKKAESPNASYENISLRSEIGMEIRLTPRAGLRLGMGDYHFSNDFIVPSNPGLDVMSYMGAITYHFGPRDQRP